MATKLQSYFPMIRTRMEVLEEIRSKPGLSATFRKWEEGQQKEFVDFCTGVRGVKLLYDSFFKEIINPESTPERLEEFLTQLLGQAVKIHGVLPNDSARIADEGSLLILDILVELEDGSLANVEAQKVGYKFPGERCACYSADLLLRQYKRVRSDKKDKFSYKDIKQVYTIVLFERSPKAFHDFPSVYRHRMKQKSDTGIEIPLLQEYVFVPLDIFRKNLQNRGIENDLDAWLAFLSVDEPEMIIRLIEKYPRFQPMYEQVYEMCRNIERVMGLYSEELRIMDRNTVQLMIDELQGQIDEQKGQIDAQKEQIDVQKERIDIQKERIDEQKEQLDQKNSVIDEQAREIAELKRRLEEKK